MGRQTIMTRTRNDKQRQAILAAAYKLLTKAEPKDITLMQIANKSSISKSLLEYYYPRKNQIWQAVAQKIARLVLDKVYHLAAPDQLEKVYTYSYLLMQLGQQDDDFYRILLHYYSNYKHYLKPLLLEFDQKKQFLCNDQISPAFIFMLTGTANVYFDPCNKMSAQQLAKFSTQAYATMTEQSRKQNWPPIKQKEINDLQNQLHQTFLRKKN